MSIDLDNYLVSADEPSVESRIVVLICAICGQHGKPADVRWWPRDYSPSISGLIREAEIHEKKGHEPR